jgi:hypothetical protein
MHLLLSQKKLFVFPPVCDGASSMTKIFFPMLVKFLRHENIMTQQNAEDHRGEKNFFFKEKKF